MKKFLLSAFSLIFSLQLVAQSHTVNTINYNSTTRDTVVEFPTGDHNQYEKILMHYSMRCKDGLISDFNDRNKGCGDWDYSCNTYIVDSTRVDSIRQVSPDFVITGFGADTFPYRDEPTYTFTQSTQIEVMYNNIITQKQTPAVEGDLENTTVFGKSGNSAILTYLLKADELVTAGADMDEITGLSFNITNGELTLKNLRVHLAQTTDTVIAGNNYNWSQHYYYNTLLSTDENLIRFYDNFEWDGTSNVLVRVSYDTATGTDLDITNGAVAASTVTLNNNSNRQYLDINTTGHVYVEDGLEGIQNEITVAFWQYGADNQPVNSTIFEGRDENNNRQANVHLPWGDGVVYWDCGGEGSSYDRINRAANVNYFKNKWNHWAFTKNATTGVMHIYLNGELWHSGTQKYRPITIADLNIGSAIRSNTLFYYGKLDEFSIWNAELDEDEIKNLMYAQPTAAHEHYDNLEVYYSFDNFESEGATDLSANGNDGAVVGQILARDWAANASPVGAVNIETAPELNIHQGIYFVWTEEHAVIDSFINHPNKVDHYIVEGTDLMLENTFYVYEGGSFPILNEDGNVVDNVDFPATDTISISDLVHYSKAPMAFEIMSFVTPYGVGLDLGIEGKTWTFDVTDFGPILKGNKRIYLSRGGQWQEDMNIQFEFIEGIPDRNVIDIQQIWPVQATAYGAILDDRRYEPRNFVYDPSVTSYVIKSAITGHGSEGEFIPRNHLMRIGGFTESWQVWKECADNPIFPQGGTWPFDRAGWCPGAPTDVNVIDATQYFQFLGDVSLDYSVQTASVDSRYIVDNKLIKYGGPNKNLDLGIDDVIYPNSRVEHGKFNPTCRNPKILIKNHGAEDITSATIEYGVIGSSMHTYEWEGNLRFLEETEVNLDFINALSEEGDDRMFYVGLVSVNGVTDDYTKNNELTTDILSVPYYEGDIILDLRTNNYAHETSYRVYNDKGEIIHQRIGSTLAPRTNYIDTLKNLNGCFRVLIEDTNDTGISFWYAINYFGEGSGYLRLRSTNSAYQDIATDFGKFVDYNFSVGMITDVEEPVLAEAIKIYPNPTQGDINISGLENWDNLIRLTISDNTGRKIMDHLVSQDELSYGYRLKDKISAGMYIVSLADAKRNYSTKVMFSSN